MSTDPNVPPPSDMTAAWLTERFGTPDAPGWSKIVAGDEEEDIFERTGAPVTMCWGSAREVVAELGDDRAVASGYFCQSGSTSIMSEHAEGHDLAIVDGRFLVDGWTAHVAEIGPCVLDLADTSDMLTARRLHDDFTHWTKPPNVLAPTEAV